MIGVARTASVPGPAGDRASIGALIVYAAAVAVVVSLPVVRRLYMPPRPPAEPSAFLGPYYGGPTAVDELVTAPQFTTSQAERSAHVSRTWERVGGIGANVVTVNPKPDNVNIVLGLANGTVLSQGLSLIHI